MNKQKCNTVCTVWSLEMNTINTFKYYTTTNSVVVPYEICIKLKCFKLKKKTHMLVAIRSSHPVQECWWGGSDPVAKPNIGPWLGSKWSPDTARDAADVANTCEHPTGPEAPSSTAAQKNQPAGPTDPGRAHRPRQGPHELHKTKGNKSSCNWVKLSVRLGNAGVDLN